MRRAAGAPLQKADRVPLALSQFSRRAAERPCENWSAAPAAAPYFVHRTRSPPLPLLRLAASSAGRARLRSPPPLDEPPGLRPRPCRGSEPQTAPPGCRQRFGVLAPALWARPLTGALNHRLLLLAAAGGFTTTAKKRACLPNRSGFLASRFAFYFFRTQHS